MKRDFSIETKNALLSRIKELEGDGKTEFTQMGRNRWIDFQSIMAVLGVTFCIHKVNAYQRKYVEKCSGSRQKLEKVFDEINRLDSECAKSLDSIQSELRRRSVYMKQLSNIINPSGGVYSAFLSGGLSSNDALVEVTVFLLRQDVNGRRDYNIGLIQELLKRDPSQLTYAQKYALITVMSELKNPTSPRSVGLCYNSNVSRYPWTFETDLTAKDIYDKVKDYVDIAKDTTDSISGLLDKKTGSSANSDRYSLYSSRFASVSNEASIYSTGFGYMSAVSAFFSNTYKNSKEIVSGAISFAKSSIDAEKGIYKYLLNRLDSVDPLESARFEERFQSKMLGASLVSSSLGFTNKLIDTVSTFRDETKQTYEKIVSVLESGKSSLDVVQSGLECVWKKKYLMLDPTKGESTFGVTEASKNATEKLGNTVKAVKAVFDIGIGGVKEYHEATSDGSLSGQDIADVFLVSGARGAASMINSFTFGVPDALFNLTENSGKIAHAANDFIQSPLKDLVEHEYATKFIAEKTEGLINYIEDENANVAGRFVAGLAEGVALTGGVVVDSASYLVSTAVEGYAELGELVYEKGKQAVSIATQKTAEGLSKVGNAIVTKQKEVVNSISNSILDFWNKNSGSNTISVTDAVVKVNSQSFNGSSGSASFGFSGSSASHTF